VLDRDARTLPVAAPPDQREALPLVDPDEVIDHVSRTPEQKKPEQKKTREPWRRDALARPAQPTVT
jgi:hypothetical protein